MVGEFNYLGRPRVFVLRGLGVLVEELLQFVHGVQAAPCLVGQLSILSLTSMSLMMSRHDQMSCDDSPPLARV